MTSRYRNRSWLLLALLACLGVTACAGSDGGVGGTGIATIRGNVLDPDTTIRVVPPNVDGSAASAAGIAVTVRNSDVRDVTDDAGFFELEGLIAGSITIDFTRDDLPVASAVQVLVPVESEIVLDNVELVGAVADPESIRVENLTGDIVGEATCDDDGGSFVLRDRGGTDFTIRLDADTVIRHASTGDPLSCSDLSEDSGTTKIRGSQQDLHITADEVQVARRGTIPGR